MTCLEQSYTWYILGLYQVYIRQAYTGLIPDASEETLEAVRPSEMKLYKHAMAYKWTVDELIATINWIKSNDFKVEDVK
jgi:hypothetical protein